MTHPRALAEYKVIKNDNKYTVWGVKPTADKNDRPDLKEDDDGNTARRYCSR